MKQIVLAFLVLACSAYRVFAQELSQAVGKVEVVQDKKIGQLQEKYKQLSQWNKAIDGYRVQIYFNSGSNSKSKATAERDAFMTQFPGVGAYISYKEPYFRVRVGNFPTLAEAVGFQKKIAEKYPNAFPVKDDITF